MKTKKKLPEHPGRLILLALKDLEKCERSKKYKINMDYWHTPNSKCNVCWSGSVMAKSLNVCEKEEVYPGDFDKEVKNKLNVLDKFREYLWQSGFNMLNIEWEQRYNKLDEIAEIAYEHDKKQWKGNMRKAAKVMLEEIK